MYLFITDIFYDNNFCINLFKFFKNPYLSEIDLFKKICSTAVKVIKKKDMF